MAAPVITNEDLHLRRLLAAKWLEWSCRVDDGAGPGVVQKDDTRYVSVTEGRDRTPEQQRIYSSCGDLAHWLLYRLGVREPWLNRRELHGWKSGLNVARLVGHSDVWLPARFPALDAGDVLVVANCWPGTPCARCRAAKRDGIGCDSHVVCVVTEYEGALCTAQYGASGMRVGGPGGRLVALQWDRRHVGTRIVRCVLPLARVLSDAAAHGLLADPDVSVDEDQIPTRVDHKRPTHD